MLTAKQFAISIAAALTIGLGTSQGRQLLEITTASTTTAATTTSPSTIQVALLLDTSSSMDGLIEQAKTQLWKILNELNRMRKNGEVPNLEVALYEYGNTGRHHGRAFEINQLSGFTTDMDLISQQLFSLSTNGGDEFCGATIQAALDELAWKEGDGLRIIYIAGNEEFTQGHLDFRKACANAVERGIIVNTIHCGDCEEGIRVQWQAGAKAGKGEYGCIDQDQRTAYVQTPYDDQLNELNTALNNTYIPIGSTGRFKKQNQTVQDANAAAYDKSNAAERAAFKSSKNYKAEDWDLVDAYKRDKKVLENKAELPDSLQNLSIEEMERRIEAIASQRETVQRQMQELDAKRRQFIEQQESPDGKADDLGNSILQALRKQASEKGFELEKS